VAMRSALAGDVKEKENSVEETESRSETARGGGGKKRRLDEISDEEDDPLSSLVAKLQRLVVNRSHMNSDQEFKRQIDQVAQQILDLDDF